MPVPHLNLKADCASCAGLCCVVLAFDESDMFAFDKEAGTACQHLGTDDLCTIHNALKQRGFAGCVQYDCLGAGQRVVNEVFAGKSWRNDPDLIAKMGEALRILRQVHELIGLLSTAKAQLPLLPDHERQVLAFEIELLPVEGWTTERLNRFEVDGRGKAIKAFLESLRELVPSHMLKS